MIIKNEFLSIDSTCNLLDLKLDEVYALIREGQLRVYYYLKSPEIFVRI